MRAVVCPVVTEASQVLAFRHPLAGVQLVKGGIAPGESVCAAAGRELREEAGIVGSATGVPVFREDIASAERWAFIGLRTADLPARWTHHCADDGGHDFAFFGHPIGQPWPAPHAARFDRARAVIEVLS